MEDKFIFTKHAKKRMLERNIEVNEIKETIEFPDYVVKKENKTEYHKKIMNKILKIVSIKKGNFIKIITVVDKQ